MEVVEVASGSPLPGMKVIILVVLHVDQLSGR